MKLLSQVTRILRWSEKHSTKEMDMTIFEELQKAISAEVYERAAVLRDRIHALEGKIGS